MMQLHPPIPRWMPRSLRSQILGGSLTILAILLLFIGVLQYVFMKEFMYQNQAETIVNQMRALPRELLFHMSGISSGQEVELIETEEEQNQAERIKRPYAFLPDSSLAIIDAEGNSTLVTELSEITAPQLSPEEYNELLKSSDEPLSPSYRILTAEDGTQQLVAWIRLGPPGRANGFLQMGTELGPLRDVLTRQLMIFVGLAFLALLLGAIVSLRVLRRTLRPLSNLVEAVRRTDAGNLSERLPEGRVPIEMDRLAVSFNHMLERLHASFEAEREAKEQMRRFVADASHELRTPLTSIQGFLEVLLRGAAHKPEQLQLALKSMHGESLRINKLVEDLLLLAKLDRSPQEQRQLIRMDDMLHSMMPQLRMLSGNRRLEMIADDAISVWIDKDQMKQVILNLFQNAVQHTDPAQGSIVIRLQLVGDDVQLDVEDNGTGIQEDHLPYVFDRFFRSDSSRNRELGGAGLGLSISKSIVDAHHGTLHAENLPDRGCKFSIRMPSRAPKP